ncbi:TRAP transporter large permease [Aurantimonas endophytica]|uniref:TRAP transporter large permease protein n=1 Tax=Aurantimonas endophytica TaxID=1522175 RepID=A0A7W6MP71_9HYPH|nr:TRAP transporter large permease [Aurantimonas endophytica]MBB4002614.1 tripartite ATP-independent transporter DctM subunit [Aurantimonas endophytica]MCO6403495.1 TRAP transporter large permease subunit [Aurantimonas endophytica]
MVWWILLAGFAITAITGVPIGIGLALTGMAILQFVVGNATDLAVNAVWNVFTDFTLSAVPLFIFMGEIMLVSGVSGKLYSAVAPLFTRVPGKLLHTNIAVSALFGAVSGASTSTAAAIGSVAYPELEKRGYKPSVVVGTLAAGGTLGLLIPPSLSLLIYGATQQVSIGQLFLAGLVPGLMLAVMMMLYIGIVTSRTAGVVPDDGERVGLRPALRLLLPIWPIGFLIFAVLGTIYTGLATPTEAAGLGVAAAVILGFLWGDLTGHKLWNAFVHSVQVFVSIGVVMLGALILAQAISILGLPLEVMSWIESMNLTPIMVLVLVSVFYLVLGCFFDGISLMLMTLPIVFPVMTGVGFDPVWLGVIITILIEIGMLTPPVGMNLYVLTGITGNRVTLLQAAYASTPFWILLLLGVVILTVFPSIVLFLPRTLF